MRKSLGLNRERKGDLHNSVSETSLHALGTQTTRSFAGRDTGQSSRASLTTQDIFLKQIFNFQDVFQHKCASIAINLQLTLRNMTLLLCHSNE